MQVPIIRMKGLALFNTLCICFLLLGTTVEAAPPSPEFKVGERLSVQGITLPEETSIIDVQKGDVTGDRANDTVLLVGQKAKDNPSFYPFITVVVQDGKTGRFSTPPDSQTKEYLRGYEPKLFLGDFSGDKLQDVMVTVATGGSGGTYNHLIASWKNNNPHVFFGEKENQGLKIRGKYLNGFKAELYSETLNQTFIVDVSGLKDEYIDAKVYDANGTYIYQDPNPGRRQDGYVIFSDPFALLVPVDVDNDGVYELRGEQSVWGPFHVLTFTTVKSTWKYKNKKWDITDAQYTLTYEIPQKK